MHRQFGRMWTRVDGRWVHARRTFALGRSGTDRDPRTPTVVLVHGLGMSSRYMLPLLDALGSRVDGFAVDLPGYGRSENPPRRLSTSGLVDALAAWLDATNLKTATLVGNSLGAQLAVQFAVRYPERVDGLVLVGMTCDPVSGGPVEHLGRLTVDAVRERPALAAVAAQDYLRAGVRHMWGLLSQALRASVVDELARIQAPTLVVRGARDPISGPEWNRRVASLIPGAAELEIPDAPHAVNFSAPAPLADAILEFLAR